MTGRGVVIAAALAGLATAGAAQQRDVAPGPAAGVLDGFRQCRAIAAAEARLACFEAATDRLERAVAVKEVTLVDKQEIRRARRSLFGFTLPRIALFGGGAGRDAPDEPEFTELNTTVTSAHMVENGRVQFQIAEGEAVWRTTDPVAFPFKPGAKVRIRQGALGNYFIAVAGERTVRGNRVR
jgi:hypothetical protein